MKTLALFLLVATQEVPVVPSVKENLKSSEQEAPLDWDEICFEEESEFEEFDSLEDFHFEN